MVTFEYDKRCYSDSKYNRKVHDVVHKHQPKRRRSRRTGLLGQLLIHIESSYFGPALASPAHQPCKELAAGANKHEAGRLGFLGAIWTGVGIVHIDPLGEASLLDARDVRQRDGQCGMGCEEGSEEERALGERDQPRVLLQLSGEGCKPVFCQRLTPDMQAKMDVLWLSIRSSEPSGGATTLGASGLSTSAFQLSVSFHCRRPSSQYPCQTRQPSIPLNSTHLPVAEDLPEFARPLFRRCDPIAPLVPVH